MADEPSRLPDRRDSSVYLDAVEGLRDDVREDIGHLRDDVREDIHYVRSMLTDFVAAHAKDHVAQRAESEQAHETFAVFIRNFELAQARKDGALGVFRFVLEQLSRHARPLVGLGVGIVTAIAAITGAFRIEVVVR